MKTISEINKLNVDVANATILLCLNTVVDLLLSDIADMINIPVKGTNNNDISNIRNKP